LTLEHGVPAASCSGDGRDLLIANREMRKITCFGLVQETLRQLESFSPMALGI